MARKRAELRSASARGVRPSLTRRLLHLQAVLVGAGEEEHVLAVEPLEARDRVGGDRLVGMADMGRPVGVGDGRRDVEFLLARSWWQVPFVWLIVESEEFARQGCGSDQRIRAPGRPTAAGKTNQKRESFEVIVSVAVKIAGSSTTGRRATSHKAEQPNSRLAPISSPRLRFAAQGFATASSRANVPMISAFRSRLSHRLRPVAQDSFPQGGPVRQPGLGDQPAARAPAAAVPLAHRTAPCQAREQVQEKFEKSLEALLLGITAKLVGQRMRRRPIDLRQGAKMPAMRS